MTEPTPNMIQPKIAVANSWKDQARRIHREAQVFYFAFKHPRVPWYAKVVAVSMAGYLSSPIQLIPSFIPVIGFSDDFLVLFLGVKLFQRIIPPGVLRECREFAQAAELRRRDEIRSTAAVVAFVAVVALWFLAAITASRMVATHIYRCLAR